MNKLITAALGLAVVALPVLAAPALAQDDRECDRAQREVARVELRLAGVVTEEREAERALLDAAREALNTAQALPQTNDVERAARRAAIDAARSVLELRERELNTDSPRLADLRVELKAAAERRDEACNDDPAPTTSPAPTTTAPAPTATTPPPAPADVDCGEVSDAEAQRLLDSDRVLYADLDRDGDGIACEDDIRIDNDVDVVVPNGGVNTGGGPA